MRMSRCNLVVCLVIAAPVSVAWAALAANAGDSQAGNGAVMNERFIEVLDSDVLLRLWEQEVEGGLIAPFYSIALDGRTYSRSRQTDYVIKLRYSNFDPTVATPNVPAALAAGEDSELYLVQFVVPPLEQFREEIRALGGTVLRFMANHTHIVRMNAMSSEAVAELPFVGWVGRFHAAYKADDEILAAYAAGFPESEAVRFSIEVFERGAAQQTAVKTVIEAAGGVVHFITPLGFRMEATLTPQLLLGVLHMDEVHVAHPKHFGDAEDMDVVRQISGANFIESTLGFTGQGVRGESFDSGFQINHQDFTPTPIWRTA
ncbi:MAG: hypothetical protein IID33_14895, partial [Planctomycetes bacterium]|nr:hypothetical protein [Planctomycetota bacterium]